MVEALYDLEDDQEPTSLIRAIAQTYPTIWGAAEGDSDRERLESMLRMMGANRSSSLIVWTHPTLGPCMVGARPLP